MKHCPIFQVHNNMGNVGRRDGYFKPWWWQDSTDKKHSQQHIPTCTINWSVAKSPTT